VILDHAPKLTPVHPTIGAFPKGVFVWFLQLAAITQHSAWASGVISPDEQKRFGRLRPTGATARRILCRATLRARLGACLGLQPGNVSLYEGRWGKPGLADPEAAKQLDFNLSHSGDGALLVLSRRGLVGVDIESMGEHRDLLGMARWAFTDVEAAEIASRHGEERIRHFYGIWCSKEATMKADGRGLAMGLSKFRVDLGEAHPRLEANPPLTRWKLWHLAVPEGYVGVLALRNPGEESESLC